MRETIEPLFFQESDSFYLRRGGRKPPKGPTRAKLRAELKTLLGDDATHSSLTMRGSKISSCIVAQATLGAFKVPIVNARLFHFAPRALSPEAVYLEVDRIRARFSHRVARELTVEVAASNTKMLETLAYCGFVPRSYMMLGTVERGLTYLLRRPPLSPEFVIRPMDYDRDIAAVVQMERAAHGADPTSVVHRHISSRRADVRGLYRRLCKSPSVALVMTHGTAVVGIITMYPLKDDPQTALISTVAVSPTVQGRGLGNALYREALLAMRRLGCQRYVGWTTTNRVLNHAQKLGRRITGVTVALPFK